MTSGTWLNNNHLASIHGQKCIRGSHGMRHHTPDAGGVWPTCVLVTDVWTSVPAVDPTVAVTWLVSLSAAIWEPGEHCNHPWMREPLWKPGFPAEKFQHNVGAKHTSLDALERVRGMVSLSPHPLSPEVGQRAQCQARVSQP